MGGRKRKRGEAARRMCSIRIERNGELMTERRKKCAGCRKQSCDGCSLRTAGKLHSDKGKGFLFPEDFKKDDHVSGLGIAYDVGSTTIAGMLWDLKKGELLGTASCLNPGRRFGGDVVSRISYSRQNEKNKKNLQSLMTEKLDELAKELWEQGETNLTDSVKSESAACLQEAKNGQRCIGKAVIAGNTAMCEMLLGFDLEGLSHAPFHKEYRGCVRKTGAQIGFSFLKEAEVTILPAIEGFVGADALAVYAYVKHQNTEGNVLTVDIGTNGEILLIGKEKAYACSTAAGPALEGAAVSSGMSAASGAIEEVRMLGSFPREDIYCKVIGDAAPIGICGSGLADALALLSRLGVIEESGYLKTVEEARKAGIRETICRRLCMKDGENQFLLTDQEQPVYLAVGDIRQLQLAKGAIRAGIEMLLQKEGISKGEISRIYLAGAFGSYLKPESAVEIGLLPDVPLERIVSVGNCAGTGAVMALFSEKIIKDMERDAEKICHVELAKEEGFQECFLQCMAVKRL